MLLLALTATTVLSRASAGAPKDHGVFIISLAGRKVGTENFDIRSSGEQIEAKAEIELQVEQGGKSLEARTFPDLVLNSRFEPLTYSWSQKGPQSSRLEIDFRKSPVQCLYHTISGQEDRRDFDLPQDVVVLDDNVLHHYELVALRLGRSLGAGRQTLKAFIPQEAAPGALTIENLGEDLPAAGGQKDKLQHLRITTELSQIDLWVDKQQRLERVSIPASQFEAVRKP